jgi:hypothetical protein
MLDGVMLDWAVLYPEKKPGVVNPSTAKSIRSIPGELDYFRR